jgi:hypothetical protein
MPIDINTVTSFTRQNTGKHFLDSGDYYGRVYETPAPCGLFSVARDGTVSLTLTGLLAQYATMVAEVQEALEAALAADERLGHFEVGPQVMEALGYEQVARDNTYNGEQDLDQNFVYEVWQKEGCDREWIYDETAIVLVYAHTGCDVRGGYSTPLAVRFAGEYSIPVDLVVSFSPADAAAEVWCIWRALPEGFAEAGYTSNPQYRLHEVVGEFVSHDPETQTLTFVNPHRGEDEEEPATVAFRYDYRG